MASCSGGYGSREKADHYASERPSPHSDNFRHANDTLRTPAGEPGELTMTGRLRSFCKNISRRSWRTIAQWQTSLPTTFCGNLPTAPAIGPSGAAIRARGGGASRKLVPRCGRRISASSISRCIPSPIRTGPSPKSRRRDSSSLRARIYRQGLRSVPCAPLTERSHSYANTSILFVAGQGSGHADS